eukprot:TRINITY_DN10506_c0_g2_i2.p1 TRINITY_DN10506_c0_g2~~TRINITY_DN10506_c0_g2_i2.p1  ORF type:complete len:209 (+),score=42.78 TRINITY_DN10506_c0_g2_i2:95-628(+)
MFVDKEKQLAFYASYHHETINQWIHIICVPLILWSSMVFVAEVETGLPVNAPQLVAIVYGVFYMLMDPVIASPYLLLLFAMQETSTMFIKEVENPYILAIALHVVCWIFQFIGHGVFEKRAPALLTSFFQSLLLAPFFVWVEVLFKLGFQKDLHERVNHIVCKQIHEWKQAEQAKSN